MNVIGEHTDYNDGLVLPAALQFECWVRAEPRDDGQVRVRSANLGEEFSFHPTSPSTPRRAWTDYVEGVAREIASAGIALPGADLELWSDVPLGAGLSSSAALEVSVAWALISLSGAEPARLQVAQLCQKAEIDFVGMRCGIMDQFIACFGEPDRAVLLDCATLDHRPVALPAGTTLVVANTMVKHELASSAYNQRREECEEAARRMGVATLRRARLSAVEELPQPLRDRARHVVTEIARVEAVAATDSASAWGRLMNESHASLRDCYQVSARELDVMAAIAQGLDGCYGSRMTGGGFGGCTVSLVDTAYAESFALQLARRYREQMGVEPPVYICRASRGAGEAAF